MGLSRVGKGSSLPKKKEGHKGRRCVYAGWSKMPGSFLSFKWKWLSVCLAKQCHPWNAVRHSSGCRT